VMVVLNKSKAELMLDTRRFAEMLPAGARGVDVISGEARVMDGPLKLAPRSVRVIQLQR